MDAREYQIETVYDVVICGGGLAGLALARQITREIPAASLLLLEGVGDKSNTGAIQVGESTIEISANYLGKVLGLHDYLVEKHYRKWGLRFFFGNGHIPFDERPEVGTSHTSPINSYQLDRAMLEKDLKDFNTAIGVQMISGSKVEDITLATDNGLHQVTFVQKSNGQRHQVQCRWVVDAMGRRRFLQKKLGIVEAHNQNHSASWFRLKGRIDVCDLVPRTQSAWHKRVPDNNRYYSTNHLMDNGRWVWLIPLASGSTSIGIVTHEEYYPFSEYNTYERAIQWLHKHEPLLWDMIHAENPVDFQCLRHYSYGAKQVFSSERWACTGDAAIFADPFLSPGIDQIGFANTIITHMIQQDRAQQLTPQMVERLNEAFISFHNGTVWIIQPAYRFFSNGLVMGTKLVWDFARGFSLNAAQRFNNIYLDEQKTAVLQPVLSQLFLLTLRMEKLFKTWAAQTSGRYRFDFVDYFAVPGIMDLYLQNFQTNKATSALVEDHQRTLAYLEEFVQIIFLLALADTNPQLLMQMPRPLWLNAWGVGLDEKRWKADKLFSPTSQPRPLRLQEFAEIFGITDLPRHLLASPTAGLLM